MSDYYDSTGKAIHIGDRVKFRGNAYTIAEFLPGTGRHGIAGIRFTEQPETAELPDEWSVDRLPSDSE